MKRAAAAVFIAFVILFWRQPRGVAQQLQVVQGAQATGDLRNSAFSIAASASDDVHRLSPIVEGWVADGTLARRLVYDDTDVLGRRHEALTQYYNGIPVYGGNVMRQTDRGAAVSIFGTIYSVTNIDVSPKLTRSDRKSVV